MNYADEDYVRLYTADTTNWKMFGWEGQTVLMHMLRKFDHSGVFEFGRHGAVRAIVAITGLPTDIVERGLKPLLDEETWAIDGNRLLWPTLPDAQNCRRSDKYRKRQERSRRLTDEPGHTGVTFGHTGVTNVTTLSRSVQCCPDLSRNVTPGKARQGKARDLDFSGSSGSDACEAVADPSVANENASQSNALPPVASDPPPPATTEPPPVSEARPRASSRPDPLRASFTSPSAGVVELFETYRSESGKTGLALDHRAKELFDRLNHEGVTADEIRECVRGAKLDDWGRDVAKLSPSAILGSSEQRDKFRSIARNPPKPKGTKQPKQPTHIGQGSFSSKLFASVNGGAK